eukprot:3114003-Rhodomonas_salina.1
MRVLRGIKTTLASGIYATSSTPNQFELPPDGQGNDRQGPTPLAAPSLAAAPSPRRDPPIGKLPPPVKGGYSRL